MFRGQEIGPSLQAKVIKLTQLGPRGKVPLNNLGSRRHIKYRAQRSRFHYLTLNTGTEPALETYCFIYYSLFTFYARSQNFEK